MPRPEGPIRHTVSPCRTVTPVQTVWRRPCRAVSICRASASSAGLPSFLSSRNTIVSAVMTISSASDATAWDFSREI